MNGLQRSWLVAVREMIERSRSRAFRASLLVMIIAVVGAIVLPAMLDNGDETKHVGITGAVSTELPRAIRDQGDAVDRTVRTRRFDDVADGEDAVRDGDVDVLVVDSLQLEWPNEPDEQLRAVVAGAIQLVAVQERATAAGTDPDDLLALVAPSPSRTSSSARWPAAAPGTRRPRSS